MSVSMSEIVYGLKDLGYAYVGDRNRHRDNLATRWLEQTLAEETFHPDSELHSAYELIGNPNGRAFVFFSLNAWDPDGDRDSRTLLFQQRQEDGSWHTTAKMTPHAFSTDLEGGLLRGTIDDTYLELARRLGSGDPHAISSFKLYRDFSSEQRQVFKASDFSGTSDFREYKLTLTIGADPEASRVKLERGTESADWETIRKMSVRELLDAPSRYAGIDPETIAWNASVIGRAYNGIARALKL